MIKNLTIVAVLVIAGGGCGAPTPEGLPGSRHQGIMVPLPEKKGFAEIVIGESEGRGGKKARDRSQMSAYFYQPDGSTEMSPAPTDVTIKVGTAASSPVLKMTASTKGDGKYTSEPAPVPEGFRGELNATIGGEATQVPFTIR